MDHSHTQYPSSLMVWRIFYIAPTLTWLFCSGSEEHTYIDIIFYSSVIEDASHPSCRILWDYKYTEPAPLSNYNCKPSLLPGCFNAESREGYHMTYYWFNVLDWEIG